MLSIAASTASTIAIWLLLARNCVGQVFPMSWANESYGPDGPWHALSVAVGSSKKTVHLLPAASVVSFIPNEYICKNQSLQTASTRCSTNHAARWNYNSSSTFLGPWDTSPALFTTPLAFDFGGQLVRDTMYIGESAFPMANCSFASMDWAYYSYPSGKQIPPTVGFYEIGAPVSYWNLYNGLNMTLPPVNLYNNGKTSSMSYSLQIGSVQAGIPPSMYYGGYDMSRAIGPVLSQPMVVNTQQPVNYSLETTLAQISIGIAEGGSPFPKISAKEPVPVARYGDLLELRVKIEPGTPYISLPRHICDSIVKMAALPVRYESSYNLYVWDQGDSRYERIVNSASFLSFKLMNGLKNTVDIKVPWKLLNLDLERPLSDKKLKYFPCYPQTDEIYSFGRAFLQAALIGADFSPESKQHNWFISQAPGPNLNGEPVLESITYENQQVYKGDDKTSWECTWNGHWSVLPGGRHARSSAECSTNSSDSDSEATPSWRIGLWVGLGIGLQVVLFSSVAICVYRRRRRRRKEYESQKTLYSEKGPGDKHTYIPYGGRHETVGNPIYEKESSWFPTLGKPGNPAEVEDPYTIPEASDVHSHGTDRPDTSSNAEGTELTTSAGSDPI